MTTETNGMEKFTSEGEVTSLSCRVHVQGIYREDEVQDWLTMKDPDLGVKTVPSDEFEEWDEDGMATYVTIYEIDEPVGVEPDY